MKRLKLPLYFAGLMVVTLLMCSCSHANAGTEPNLALGIIAVNDGSEGKIAVAAEMPILITRAEKFTAIRTSSSFSSTNNEKYYVVMNVVGAIWGRNPVIKTSYVAVQFNPSGMEANYKFFVQSGDIFGQTLNVAWETLVRGQLVMPGNAEAINSTVISDASISTSGAISTTAYAMHDKLRAGDMLGRFGGINNNIKAGINPVIKAVIVHDTIEV